MTQMAKPFTARIPSGLFGKLHDLQEARSTHERHRIPLYFLVAEALERYISEELPRFIEVSNSGPEAQRER
jgi:hypothetical protein